MPIAPILPWLSGPAHANYAMPPSPVAGDAAGTGSRAMRAAAQEFEAFVLQSFVEAMLPKEAASAFGGGTAGAFWRSLLAEHVARELARAGGVGIARLVAPEGANPARSDR